FLGLPVLGVVRLRRDLVGGDCGRAARVLLSHRAVGRGDAVCRLDRPPPGDRLDDGHGRLRARCVLVAAPRSADRRDDRMHLRSRSDYHGCRAPDDSAPRAGRYASDELPRPRARPLMQCRNCGAQIADKALICYRCGTATTEAKYQPAPLTRSRSRSGLVATVLALALLVAIALFMGLLPARDNPRDVWACDADSRESRQKQAQHCNNQLHTYRLDAARA